jgi:hypothetical protein
MLTVIKLDPVGSESGVQVTPSLELPHLVVMLLASGA